MNRSLVYNCTRSWNNPKLLITETIFNRGVCKIISILEENSNWRQRGRWGPVDFHETRRATDLKIPTKLDHTIERRFPIEKWRNDSLGRNARKRATECCELAGGHANRNNGSRARALAQVKVFASIFPSRSNTQTPKEIQIRAEPGDREGERNSPTIQFLQLMSAKTRLNRIRATRELINPLIS